MGSRRLVRALLAVVAGSVCGVGLTCGVVALAGDPGAAEAGGADPGAGRPGNVRAAIAGADDEGPREVLRAWDAARSAAWHHGDLRALRRLYTPRSVAGHADVAMLRAWNRRGLRVTAMTTQVLALRVRVDDRRRLVLRVTDRLVEVAAGAITLPRDEVSTRTIELRRHGARRWRVAAVSER